MIPKIYTPRGLGKIKDDGGCFYIQGGEVLADINEGGRGVFLKCNIVCAS